MELKGIMLSEISQTEKVKQCMLSLMCRKTEMISHRGQTSGYQWGVGRRKGQGRVCGGPGHSHQSSNRSWSFHGSGYWLYLLGIWPAQGPPQCVFHLPREQLSWKALNTFLGGSRMRMRIRIRAAQMMAIATASKSFSVLQQKNLSRDMGL